MEKLLRAKSLWLFFAVGSAVLGGISIAGIIFFILKLWYVPMAVCILITAHGFYGCPFYFIEYSDIKRCELILNAIEAGDRDVSVIAEKAMVKEEFAKVLIEKTLKKGYLTAYIFDGEKITEESA
jgi:hypothetical protein